MRIRFSSCKWFAFALALATAACGPTPLAIGQCGPPCGADTVTEFARLVRGDQAMAEAVRLTAGMAPGQQSTLLELKQLLQSMGISVVGVKADASALLSMRGPKIAHLRNPDHFVVVGLNNSDVVQLVETGAFAPLGRAEFAQRYSGAALVLPQDTEAGPRIELPKFDDLEEITRVGETLTYDFAIKNVGTKPLEVTVLRSTCSCVATLANEPPVPAGDQGLLKVTLQVYELEGFAHRLTLSTNDPLVPRVDLTVRGEVAQDLVVTPDRLFFAVRRGHPQSRQIVVKSPMNVMLQSADTALSWLSVKLVREPEAELQRVWSIVATVPDTAPVGRYQTEIQIGSVQRGDRVALGVPVEIDVEGQLAVRPPSAFFGFVKPGQRREVKLSLVSRGGDDFRVLQVVAEDKMITVARSRAVPGGWEIPVALDARTPGVIRSRLVVTTDCRGEERIEIPLYAHVTGE
jgi:hypothetical protein